MEICDLLKIGPNQLLAKLYAVIKEKKTKPQNKKPQTTKNCCSYDK